MIDELRKAFMHSWTGGASGDPNRYHGPGTFDDFRFSDLFDNKRWVKEQMIDPHTGEPMFKRSGEPLYTNYYKGEAYGGEPSVVADAAPRFVPSPDAAGVYPEFDKIPEVTPQARPVPIRGIERGRTVYPSVPRTVTGTVVPPRTTAFPPHRQVGLPAPAPALPRPQTNVSRGYRTPPGGLARGVVTGPYNPDSLDSYARYYQDRANRLAENRARVNQAKTVIVPSDPNTERAYARTFQQQPGRGGTPTVEYRPYDPRNPWFYRRFAKNVVEGGKKAIGALGSPLSAGVGALIYTDPAEANHASGVVPQGGYFDSFFMDESYKPPTGLGPNAKRVTTETPDGKKKIVTTEEIDPIADQHTMVMETAPQFNYVPEPGEMPVQRDQYGNLYNYSMTDAQRDAVNEMRRAQQFEQAENYDDSDFSLMEYLKKILGWGD